MATAKEYLYRRNAVLETLRSNRRKIHSLWLQKGSDRKLMAPLVDAARQIGITPQIAEKRRLSNLTGDSSHQGVVLEVGGYPYCDVDDMLSLAQRRGEAPFLLLFDLLHGPNNIGSLLRTAEIVGVHGVIMQDRRAPDITPTVVTHAAGATEHLQIARVVNLAQTMNELKQQDIWMAGLDIDETAQPLGKVDLNRPLGLVVGHEGSGLRRRVHQSCDFIVKIPMRGRVESLNAAAAGAVMLYSAWQSRGFSGG